jgi:SHS2 domain-containing protein
LSGETPEARLVGLLRELVFLLETRRWVARELAFQTEDEAHWNVQGRFVTVPSAQMAREVKSPTYHQLQVRTSPDWRAEIYFDL